MRAQAKPFDDRPIRSEDVLPDQDDRIELDGVQMRKGTVAAFRAERDPVERPRHTGG